VFVKMWTSEFYGAFTGTLNNLIKSYDDLLTKLWFSTSEVYSHHGRRSTSIPEGKISSLPIVVAVINSKPEAGIFGSAARHRKAAFYGREQQAKMEINEEKWMPR
jgi:hypothetical protein